MIVPKVNEDLRLIDRRDEDTKVVVGRRLAKLAFERNLHWWPVRNGRPLFAIVADHVVHLLA